MIKPFELLLEKEFFLYKQSKLLLKFDLVTHF